MLIGEPVSDNHRIATVPESSDLAAYSYFDELLPIAYADEQPQCMYSKLQSPSGSVIMTHRPLRIHGQDVQQPSKRVALRVSIRPPHTREL